jgi:NCS1 family nucleobase:cation symporter-1
MIDDYSAKARAGAFFCSFGFVFGQIAENILGNGYAAGMDLAGLFPTWISIKRGTLLCALLSWAVCPWEFYNTASTFVAVAASFSVFLGPLTGIMLADYWIIRRQKIQISQLYTGSPEGSYWYTFGFNWRAIISWLVGFAPAMPGMIAAVNPSVTVNQGVLNYYRGNYLFGFAMAGGLYVILCLISKPKGVGQQDEEDIYGTFEEETAIKRGITPWEAPKRLGMAEDPAAVTIVDDGAVKHADSSRPVV